MLFASCNSWLSLLAVSGESLDSEPASLVDRIVRVRRGCFGGVPLPAGDVGGIIHHRGGPARSAGSQCLLKIKESCVPTSVGDEGRIDC